MTTSLLQDIQATTVAPGSVSAWWLGGSGFAFKTPNGQFILIDPYLSESALPLHGLKRGFPAPLDPETLRPDLVISTHWHEDHCDPGTLPVIARNSPDTLFVMPPTAYSRAIAWGVPRERVTTIQCGEHLDIAGVQLEATPARHDAGIPGWHAPDAVGIVLTLGDVRVFHSGDTEYEPLLRRLKEYDLSALMLCINGVTGNMNAHEAALLAWQIGAKIVMPMHHLLWDSNSFGDAATLDPNLFAQTYRNLGGQDAVVLPEIGHEILIAA